MTEFLFWEGEREGGRVGGWAGGEGGLVGRVGGWKGGSLGETACQLPQRVRRERMVAGGAPQAQGLRQRVCGSSAHLDADVAKSGLGEVIALGETHARCRRARRHDERVARGHGEEENLGQHIGKFEGNRIGSFSAFCSGKVHGVSCVIYLQHLSTYVKGRLDHKLTMLKKGGQKECFLGKVSLCDRLITQHPLYQINLKAY